MRLILALLFAASLAGCTNDPTDVSLGGTFSSQRTQNDLTDFHFTVEAFAKDVAIMESFPERFNIQGLTQSQCEDLFARLEVKSYLTSLGPCISASNPPDVTYGN